MTNGKIKKVSGFISFIIVCAITLGLIVSVNAKSVAAENDKTEFSSEITAVSHAHGEKINILPEEVRLFNESKQFDPEYLKGLYEYTDFHREFSIIDNERLVEVYRETDAFNPVNNVLKWQSSLENVRFYKVRVAYDNKFKECVLIVDDADINAGITLENPLTGTTYYWQVIATLNSGDKVYSPIFDFTVENSLRTITVDGVSNIRDIGGYETAYGYIRQGLVYRSARLESITTDGLTVFKDKLGVKTELDLRGEAEIANFTTNIENAAGLEKHFVFDTPFYASEGEVEFSDGINGRNNWQNVKNIMSVFADKENYPIDFHCAVGRDRTGTVATLLKALLGFNEQDIINDYFTTMFSTTGAWSKSVFNNNKDGITFLLKYLNSFDGDTLADKTAEYLIAKCGMTQTQIDDIRNIMTGQEGYEVVIPAYNTFADTENYADYAFVAFEKFGTAKVVKVVRCGETVEAPFDVSDGFLWTVDGVAYDFTSAIDRDMTVKALKKKSYEINVVSTGAINSQKTVIVNEGDSFDFSTLHKDGYDFTIVSDEGRVITELTVVGKSTINVIYFKK